MKILNKFKKINAQVSAQIKKSIENERGVSIIEALVGSAIVGLIIVSSLQFMGNIATNKESAINHQNAQQNLVAKSLEITNSGGKHFFADLNASDTDLNNSL